MAKLHIRDARLKAVPPVMKMSAAYMTLINNTDKDVTIVGASSSIADYVEIHTHTNDKGVMKMRQLKSLLIKRRESVHLQAKGHHLMFIQLKRKLVVGELIPITLKMNNGVSHNFKAVVKKLEK